MSLIKAKISKKYFLIMLVVIFMTLAAVYGFTVKVMNDSYREQIRYRDELMVRSLTKRIDFIMQVMVNDMRVASLHALDTGLEGKELFSAEIQKMLARQPLYLFIQSVSERKELISRIPEPRTQAVFSAANIIDRLNWSQSYFVSNLLILPDGTRTFAVAYPVLDDSGRFHGGVIAFVDLHVLADLLNESRIGQQGVVALVDSRGTVVAHRDAGRIGESLSMHPLGPLLQLEKFGTWEGAVFGRKMLIAYRPAFLGQFGLVVGESLSQAWAPSNRVMLTLAHGFLVVLLVATGMTLLGTARVVRPIVSLTRQSREYKDNSRKSFDHIRTGDEIETLSVTMDQMAKDLTERERRLFYILESVPYAVLTIDHQGRFTTFNKSAEDLTGFHRSEVIGKSVDQFPLKAERAELIALRTLEDGQSFDEVESYIIDKRGNRHEVQIHSALYQGEDSRPQGAIVVLRDVSEVKKLEEYLRRSEQLASLGQLTAGIAHEIKNPLSIIQAAAEGIRLELDDQTDKELVRSFAEDIFTTSVRMNGLIKDFLSLAFSRGEAGAVSVNLVAVIDELLHLLKKKFQDQNILVDCACITEEALVAGRKNALTQVFLNIFLNSLQAMKDGGRLNVSLESEGGDWHVEIADTGVGISEDKLQRIFNPFFSTKSDGTGLGLSIAHEIIVDHHGKIWADSVEGEGTRMYIEIPQLEQEQEK